MCDVKNNSLEEIVVSAIDAESSEIMADLLACRTPEYFPALTFDLSGDLIEWSGSLSSLPTYRQRLRTVLRNLIRDHDTLDWSALDPDWYQDQLSKVIANVADEYAKTLYTRARWLDILCYEDDGEY